MLRKCRKFDFQAALETDGFGLPARFWAKVNKDGPEARAGLGKCWVWTGSLTVPRGNGYGLFGVKNLWCSQGKKLALVNRLMLCIKLGRPIGPGMQSLHHCDRPPCVNPAHLYEGTPKDNVRDILARGGYPDRRGVLNIRAKLSEQDIMDIRDSPSTQRSLATQYGVCKSLIGMIVRGEIWRHVP